MNKQDRLNDITLKLYNQEEIVVKHLAHLYGTSERTIQNDIKELSNIYNIISPSRGRYKLKETSPIIEKKFEEVYSKFIIKANYDIFYQFSNLVEKIEKKTGFKSTPFFEINVKLEELKNPKTLIVLMQSIEFDYTIEIEYKNQKLIIQPLKILNYDSIWHLIGFDLESNKMKSFLINKIENIISKTENLFGSDIKKLKKEARLISKPLKE